MLFITKLNGILRRKKGIKLKENYNIMGFVQDGNN